MVAEEFILYLCIISVECYRNVTTESCYYFFATTCNPYRYVAVKTKYYSWPANYFTSYKRLNTSTFYRMANKKSHPKAARYFSNTVYKRATVSRTTVAPAHWGNAYCASTVTTAQDYHL